MATYTKPLKSIEVYLLGVENPITFEDTATEPIASQMLEAFGRYDTMKGEASGTMYEIPFASVEYISVSDLEPATVERDDPYGCDAE